MPPQARQLYLRNWIRVIADVDDPGAALIPALRPDTQRPLDLSGSVLRTVSGYHLEYLRNIGVRGSMSVSLVKDGRLWGADCLPQWCAPAADGRSARRVRDVRYRAVAAARADLNVTPVSLDDVLDDVEEILGARFAETGVQLRRPMRLGVVSGDRVRLQEVLSI